MSWVHRSGRKRRQTRDGRVDRASCRAGIGAANAIYGILPVLFIIFVPLGIAGLLEEVFTRALRRRYPHAA